MAANSKRPNFLDEPIRLKHVLLALGAYAFYFLYSTVSTDHYVIGRITEFLASH